MEKLYKSLFFFTFGFLSFSLIKLMFNPEIKVITISIGMAIGVLIYETMKEKILSLKQGQ